MSSGPLFFSSGVHDIAGRERFASASVREELALDEPTTNKPASGRRGAVAIVLVAAMACSFWLYQGVLRRQRLEWTSQVRSLGVPVSIMPASKWTAQMYVPGPQGIIDREVVIVTVDNDTQGQALLGAPAECPDDVKIYAFDGLSTKRHSQIEERFPTAVVFTRLQD